MLHGHRFKHGDKDSKEYRAWKEMRQRCSNKKRWDYKYYGELGVTICERWDDYLSFLADMGRKPSPKHSLDRFPNPNGNYEPTNCRWATSIEQALNRRPRFGGLCKRGHELKTIMATDRPGNRGFCQVCNTEAVRRYKTRKRREATLTQ